MCGREYVPGKVRLHRMRRECTGPDKRYQIERKLAWAKEQAGWAGQENLLAEERQMKQLIQDCELMVEEMDLIESARRDGAQSIKVEHQERPTE